MSGLNSLSYSNSWNIVPPWGHSLHGIKANCSSKVWSTLSRTQKEGGNSPKPDPRRIRRGCPLKTLKPIPKSNSDTIFVPGWCCAAPSENFSETEEAFEKIIRDYKYDFLKIQAEYEHNIIDKQKYVTQLFSLCCKAMDIDDVKLDLTENAPNNLWDFSPTTREVIINLNGQWSLMNTIVHELNHFIQLKEQLLTWSTPEESLDIVTTNLTVQAINTSIRDGELPTQQDIDRYFRESYAVIYEALKTKYHDILYGNKYHRNTNPNDYFFKQWNRLNQATIDYVLRRHDPVANQNNYMEVQSNERWDLCERIYRSKILKSSEMGIISNLLEMVVDRPYEKWAVLDLIIEELEAHQNECYSPQDFCSYFIRSYFSSYPDFLKPEYRNLF